MVRQLPPIEQAQLRAQALRENGEIHAAVLVWTKWKDHPDYPGDEAWTTRQQQGRAW